MHTVWQPAAAAAHHGQTRQLGTTLTNRKSRRSVWNDPFSKVRAAHWEQPSRIPSLLLLTHRCLPWDCFTPWPSARSHGRVSGQSQPFHSPCITVKEVVWKLVGLSVFPMSKIKKFKVCRCSFFLWSRRRINFTALIFWLVTLLSVCVHGCVHGGSRALSAAPPAESLHTCSYRSALDEPAECQAPDFSGL